MRASSSNVRPLIKNGSDAFPQLQLKQKAKKWVLKVHFRELCFPLLIMKKHRGKKSRKNARSLFVAHLYIKEREHARA
jgi:hypothetical protein